MGSTGGNFECKGRYRGTPATVHALTYWQWSVLIDSCCSVKLPNEAASASALARNSAELIPLLILSKTATPEIVHVTLLLNHVIWCAKAACKQRLLA